MSDLSDSLADSDSIGILNRQSGDETASWMLVICYEQVQSGTDLIAKRVARAAFILV